MEPPHTQPPSYWTASDWREEPVVPVRGWGKHVIAVAETMFTTREGPPPADRLQWLWGQLWDFSKQVGGLGVFALRMSLFFLTWIAPLYVFRLPPLRRLPVERRIEAMERFERGFMGITFYALKAMLCMMYFEHPDAAREVGFDGSSKKPHHWVDSE